MYFGGQPHRAPLDGFIAESDDTLDWLTKYEPAASYADAPDDDAPMPGGYERFYKGVGVLVSGSVTYEFVLGELERGGHALHIAAITQIRFAHSPGRAFFDRKVTEGETNKETVSALKRRIADAVYRQFLIDKEA